MRKFIIAHIIAHKYSKKNCFEASFFFTKNDEDIEHANKFITMIAVQLVNNISALYQYICDTLTKHNDIVNQSLHDQ